MNPITEQDARVALLDVWEDPGPFTIRRLPGDVDVNFRVTAADGTDSILKFVDPEVSDAELDLQSAALAHLRSQLGRGVVQREMATSRGEMVHMASGRRVRRLGWLQGAILDGAIPPRLLPSSRASALFRRIGSFMGRIDVGLSEFRHPAAARAHRWDPMQGVWIAEALDAVGPAGSAPHDRRAMLERVLGAFRGCVVPRAADLPRAVIHADGNDHNLVVDGADPWAGPTGIIDFGDMLETARVCEPAVAAAYAAMRSGDPLGAVRDVFHGYDEVVAAAAHPLIPTEWEVGLTLVRMRLAISVTVSADRAMERPDDPYVTVSEGPAWRLLEALDHRAARGVELTPARVGPARPEPVRPDSDSDLLARRRAVTGTNLSLSYAKPIHAVRGWMQYLYDAEGNAFLDVYNNVPHVGHSHPRVAEAIARQSGLLATNTRYLSQLRLDYMERLAACFPGPLDTVYLLNSASEANELALRIVRTVTGRPDLIVQEAAYHGHTTSLIEISPYKAHGPGGAGTPDWVHTVAIPDPYRGAHRGAGGAGSARTAGSDVESGERSGDDAGLRYAADVGERIEALVASGRPPGAFFAETFPSVGGQIIPPRGYLAGVYAAVRGAGGLVMADEVQTGFGRLGEPMWGFQTQGVVPDIVVLGKPMANGFPMGALVTTRQIADAFDTGMEFFSTFGGNPVACAAGNAVLDVLEEEQLPTNAARVGETLLTGLRDLANRPGIGDRIGDVRGMGLFLGVEFVTDRDTRSPDADTARTVVDGLRQRGVLAGIDGPDHNVLKLRGPLVLTGDDAGRVVEATRQVLQTLQVFRDPASAQSSPPGSPGSSRRGR